MERIDETDALKQACAAGLMQMDEEEIIDMLAELAEKAETDEDRVIWAEALEIFTGPLPLTG